MVHQRFMWPFSFSNARWGSTVIGQTKNTQKYASFSYQKVGPNSILSQFSKFYNFPTECLYHVGRLKTTMLTIPHLGRTLQ